MQFCFFSDFSEKNEEVRSTKTHCLATQMSQGCTKYV